MVRTTTNAPVDIGDYPESSKPNRLVIESVKQGKTSHKEPQAHKKGRGSYRDEGAMPSIHTSEDMPPAHFKLVQAALKGRVRQGVGGVQRVGRGKDRKSTRLNSSHSQISYAVFCF